MSVANPYRQSSVSTATPGKLLIMLFDGLLRFLRQASAGIETGRNEEAHRNLIRAQNILVELRETLNPAMAPDLADQLDGLYAYFYNQCVTANAKKLVDPINEIVPQISELREAFEAAERQLSMERQG